MNRIELPALTPNSVLGFLAAIGTLRLVVDELGDSAARLGWPDGPNSGAVLESELLASLDDLVVGIQAVVDSMKSDGRLLPGVDGFPPRGEDASADPTSKLSLGDGRGLVHNARTNPALARWLQAVVAVVPPVDTKSGIPATLEKSRFFKAGPGTVWVPRTLAGVTSSLGPTSLLEAFVGWRRKDGFIGAYLDQRADVEAATGQGSKAPPKRGVPGATFLAIQAIPLFPGRTPGQFATETVGWTTSRRVPKGFAWPAWNDPIPIDSVAALVDHPLIVAAARDGSSPLVGRLRGLGVSAVFRSLRVGAGNNDAAMAPATVVWAAE